MTKTQREKLLITVIKGSDCLRLNTPSNRSNLQYLDKYSNVKYKYSNVKYVGYIITVIIEADL